MEIRSRIVQAKMIYQQMSGLFKVRIDMNVRIRYTNVNHEQQKENERKNIEVFEIRCYGRIPKTEKISKVSNNAEQDGY